MLDACISWYKSFPSRVLSPTPEKRDTPPCSVAKLRINSIISTVFPTPAPPKRPIFAPFLYGVIRSTTLMPVSNNDKSYRSLRTEGLEETGVENDSNASSDSEVNTIDRI